MIFKMFFNINIFYSFLKFTGIKYILYNTLYLSCYILNIINLKVLRSIKFKLDKKKQYILYHSNNEKFILFTKDLEVSKNIYINDSFDLNKLFKVLKLIKKRKIQNFYNIGANIGSICVPIIKRKFANKAHVVEMEPNNFRLLKLNIFLNKLEQKINTYNFAISNSDDKLIGIKYSKNNFGAHSVIERKSSKQKIYTKKFDTLFKNIPKNSLIWIDTEGHEEKVLNAATKNLKKNYPIVFEFWPKALIKNNSYRKLKKYFFYYNFFYDLSEIKPEKVKINKKNVDLFFSKWKNKSNLNPNSTIFTDILLV